MKAHGIRPSLSKRSLIPTVVLMVLLLSSTASRATEDPGNEDWYGASNSMVFRDDELLYGFVGLSDSFSVISYSVDRPTSDALTSWTKLTDAVLSPSEIYGAYSPALGSRNSVAASGRIADPLHDELAQAWYVKDGSLRVQHRRVDDGSLDLIHEAHLTGTTASRRMVDMAVGDLDKLVDDSGYYHDEIAVARTVNKSGDVFRVQVDILDYNFVTLATASINSPLAATMHTTAKSAVACTIGDFDGDHAYELAVGTYWDDSPNQSPKWQIDLFRLTTPADGGPSTLTRLLTTPLVIQDAGSQPTLDITAGDFAGSGKDQLAVAFGGVAGSTVGTLWIFELDRSLALQLKANMAFTALVPSIGTQTNYLRAEAGIFKYDPANGWDADRRQIALVWDTSQGTSTTSLAGININVVAVDPEYRPFPIGATQEGSLPDHWDPGDYIMDLAVAVGNFVGHGVDGTATSPTMQMAVLFHSLARGWQLRILSVAPTGGVLRSYYAFLQWGFGTILLPHLSAIDPDGDSWRLGAPVQISFDAAPKFDSIVEEPPKHVDYLPKDPANPGGQNTDSWQIVNIGGYSEFKVTTSSTDEGTLETSTESNSSYDIGGGGSADFEACLTVKRSCKKDPPISAGLDLAISGAYESEESTINSSTYQASFQYEDSAALDDNVTGKIQGIDVWRYPIIGYETAPPESMLGFYEVVIPSPNVTQFLGAGLNQDFYQPLHQNHNLLSYPYINPSGTKWVPADLGPFTIPDPANPSDPNATKTVTAVMNWPNGQEPTYYWDGNPTTLKLDFSTEDGYEQTKTHESSMNESADVSVGMTGHLRRLHYSVDIGLNFDSSQTWGGSSVGKTTDSSAKGVEEEKPVGSAGGMAYAFTSAVYVAQDGTFKVAHAVDPKGSSQGAETWQRQYGRAPDPALNLPFQFEWHEKDINHPTEWWSLNTEESRTRMRGFLLREATPDPVTGNYELLAGSPIDGVPVQLCARIYNFSFVDTPLFLAHFYYQLWNTQLEEAVTGEEVTQPGMAVQVAKLDSVIKSGGTPMREVCVPWDTTGLSNVASATYGYRFIVKLDEENAVTEIHESRDSAGNELKGGNNEGTYPWHDAIFVAPPTPSAAALGGAAQHATITMAGDALAVKSPSGIESANVRLTAGKRYAARVNLLSDSREWGNRILLVYDGDPKAGGKAVAARVLRGVAEGDNYQWFDWVPREIGTHEIWAHVLEPPGVAASESSWASLRVDVQEAPQPEPAVAEEGGDGCTVSASRSTSGGGALVLAAALVLIALRRPRAGRPGNGTDRGSDETRSVIGSRQ